VKSLQLSKRTKELIPKNNSVMYEKWLYYFVIPDLIRDPVFSTWISAGVYPDGIRGGNENSQIIVKKC